MKYDTSVKEKKKTCNNLTSMVVRGRCTHISFVFWNFNDEKCKNKIYTYLRRVGDTRFSLSYDITNFDCSQNDWHKCSSANKTTLAIKKNQILGHDFVSVQYMICFFIKQLQK